MQQPHLMRWVGLVAHRRCLLPAWLGEVWSKLKKEFEEQPGPNPDLAHGTTIENVSIQLAGEVACRLAFGSLHYRSRCYPQRGHGCCWQALLGGQTSQSSVGVIVGVRPAGTVVRLGLQPGDRHAVCADNRLVDVPANPISVHYTRSTRLPPSADNPRGRAGLPTQWTGFRPSCRPLAGSPSGQSDQTDLGRLSASARPSVSIRRVNCRAGVHCHRTLVVHRRRHTDRNRHLAAIRQGDDCLPAVHDAAKATTRVAFLHPAPVLPEGGTSSCPVGVLARATGMGDSGS